MVLYKVATEIFTATIFFPLVCLQLTWFSVTIKQQIGTMTQKPARATLFLLHSRFRRTRL